MKDRVEEESGRLKAAAILVLFAAALIAVSLGVLGTLSAQAAEFEADEVKEASVVVQFDDSDVIVRPISFTGEISGLTALELSGLDFEAQDFGWGTALCSIEGVGCPASDCFCGGNTFWGTSFWNGSEWEGYPVGIADTVISRTGSIEGFRWGEFPETPAPAPEALAAQQALDWLADEQSAENGSYDDKVSPSVGVMLALGANHLDASEWRRSTDAPSLLDYVKIAGIGYSHDGAAEAGRLAAGMAAADGCWSPGAATTASYYSPTLGSMSDQPGFLSWAILGTVAISDSVPGNSVDFLRGLALPDGGWEWSPGWGADTNSTAIAMQALIGGGAEVSATEIVSGLAFLKSVQEDDGGFPYAADSALIPAQSDVNSTSWVIQALLAAGADPHSDAWKEGGNSPYDFLLGVQLADGSFPFMAGMASDGYATRQAVAALLGNPHPIQVRELAACDVTTTMLPLTSSDDTQFE